MRQNQKYLNKNTLQELGFVGRFILTRDQENFCL